MLYQRKKFTVPVQTNSSHPLSADLDEVFNKNKNWNLVDLMDAFLKVYKGGHPVSIRWSEDKSKVVVTRGLFSVHIPISGLGVNEMVEKIMESLTRDGAEEISNG